MPTFKSNIYCPYCNYQLDLAPKRKAECPNCSKWIYVNKGKLITEDESNYIFWMKYLPAMGITDEKYQKYHEELSKRFGMNASVNDTVWDILNSIVSNNPFSEYSIYAYHEMARMATLEHKNPQQYIELALKTKLQINKIMKVNMVRVVCYADDIDNADCPECAKLHHKKFSVEEALEKMPIPRLCTSDYCTCEYESVFKGRTG